MSQRILLINSLIGEIEIEEEEEVEEAEEEDKIIIKIRMMMKGIKAELKIIYDLNNNFKMYSA